MQQLKKIKLKSDLGILFLVLLGLNVGVILLFDRDVSRIIRFISMVSLVMYILMKNKHPKNILIGVLCVFLLRQLSGLFYEIPWGFTFYFLLGSACYLIICFERSTILKLIVAKPLYTIIIALMIAGDFYALHLLNNQIQPEQDIVFIPVILHVYGMLMIVTGAISIIYSALLNSNRSLTFTYSVFAFLIADLSFILDYYYGLSLLSYIEVVFYLLAFVLYVIFIFNGKPGDQKREQARLHSIEDKFSL